MTIHKSQGLTFRKAWVDLRKSENIAGITYVALSRVRNLSDPVVEPITLERLQAPKTSPYLHYRIIEEQGLSKSAKTTVSTFISNNKVV